MDARILGNDMWFRKNWKGKNIAKKNVYFSQVEINIL